MKPRGMPKGDLRARLAAKEREIAQYYAALDRPVPPDAFKVADALDAGLPVDVPGWMVAALGVRGRGLVHAPRVRVEADGSVHR